MPCKTPATIPRNLFNIFNLSRRWTSRSARASCSPPHSYPTFFNILNLFRPFQALDIALRQGKLLAAGADGGGWTPAGRSFVLQHPDRMIIERSLPSMEVGWGFPSS